MNDCLNLITGNVCRGSAKTCMKYQSTILKDTPCKAYLDELAKPENKEMRDEFDDARVSVCRRFPDIPECRCMARQLDPNYITLSEALKFASQDDDQCWYKGCRDPETAMMPFAMTKKPTEIEPFWDPLRLDTSTCSPAVCNNVLDLGDADVGVAQIIQDTSACGASTGSERAPGTAAATDGDKQSSSKMMEVAIFITLILILFINVLR
jgi:hypothetical protein